MGSCSALVQIGLMATIDPDRVPTTLSEAVEILIAGVQPADRAYLDEHGIEGEHFGIGMRLRNGWSLWEPSAPLPRWFMKELKIWHADDMSGIILDAFLARYRGKPFDPFGAVYPYHKHWVDHGYNNEAICEFMLGTGKHPERPAGIN